MKNSITITFFVAATVCAVSALTDEELEKYAAECIRENGLNPALINDKLNKVKRPSLDEENCHVACIDKKMGVMKQDGTYDEEAILSNADTSEERMAMKIRLDEVMSVCNEQVGNDYCKLAACVHRMPRVHWARD